ncbi:outer membrane putative beta-barrel porin/alpha-amylase [Christiangramia gaetbulicola]|uniref:Outer membrane putative beta-barrel porin/alpha-amylase n=1 Tax=Christiangramia gaetbulicola TaxID=703340 RepID=A0A2T6AGJ8_9FLAO|nr:transporter [Christiangramia gaetbulicola]PTX42924.1 outer membrane putative beta-barrel porin/alpha-amylase [Christiangramia gaetbulicola]
MRKSAILSLFLIIATNLHAQYTETINSNRPGQSQGAFAVGTNVIQIETGPYFGSEEHTGLGTDTDIWGVDYQLRYGLLFENLELNLTGSFESQDIYRDFLGVTSESTIRNFKSNTIGAKYLIFDPHKSLKEDKPNLYSWKANQRFKWKTLIPAISIYAGANFSFGENPYLYEGEGKFSPKAAIITQNNWGRWVLVLNLIADKLSEDYRSYTGIITVTHTLTENMAIFGEYQGIKSDLYADDILRAGGAYLIGEDFQFDISGLVNFKDTPSKWQVAAGVSYRFDLHKVDEFLEESSEGNKRRQRSEELNKDEGDGVIDDDGGE